MHCKLYKPFAFQGNLKNKHYFEGWYFKHISADQKNVWSFIPGISLNKNDSHAFIQIINGITGISEYIKYSLSEFRFDNNKNCLKIGQSVFSESAINLNIEGEKSFITGEIKYHNIIKYPQTLFSPGIMGWYSFVPFMECKHGIISVNHNLSGNLTINGTPVSFDSGKGYIEKDWGISFPEAWIWIQANNFNDTDSSFSFSVAKIPWRGKFFIGFIAYLYFNKRFYLFSTHNNSIINDLTYTGDSIHLALKNKNNTLKVTARKNTFGELMAPVSGNMSRRIKESIDSEVGINLFNINNNLIYNDSSKRAGLEIIDKIFDYIKH